MHALLQRPHDLLGMAFELLLYGSVVAHVIIDRRKIKKSRVIQDPQ